MAERSSKRPRIAPPKEYVLVPITDPAEPKMIACKDCGKSHRNYRGVAKCRWGKRPEWVEGEGPFALLAHCRVLTVTLWPTLEEAKNPKAEIDASGCGGSCYKRHEIVNLDAQSPG